MKLITWRQLRHRGGLYLLLLPALALVALFSYYPTASAVYYSFFRWNGDDVAEFTGLKNFTQAFGDEILGASFVLMIILVLANLFKMVPSIVTAVMIHRMASERARYLYRVLFVIPMIIPSMVWLLLWRYIYNPQFGPLNKALSATGLMAALRALDSPEHGMPALAAAVGPWRDALAGPLFGGVWGLMLVGAAVLVVRAGREGGWPARAWLAGRVLICLAAAGLVIGLPAAGALAAMLRKGLEASPDDLKAVARGALAALTLIGALAATLVLRRYGLGRAVLKWAGLGLIGLAAVLLVTSMWWTEPTGQFEARGDYPPAPAWLGHPKLIVPALIFWGFPWVGVVSVLLYLAGLGNIDQSVYDAAEIDGCGWFRKFWNIELPLIMTQVRLNLILMIIGTFQGWQFFFILLGDTGGPQGAGMVPGLYIFRKAFRDMEAGYACAIGLLLFFLILALTWINNRYVRVQK